MDGLIRIFFFFLKKTYLKEKKKKKRLTNKSRRAVAAVATESLFANAERSAGASLAAVDVYFTEPAR